LDFGEETNGGFQMFRSGMRNDSAKVPRSEGFDWKAAGYLTSIVSVFFLGAVAWPKAGEPQWHAFALILGVTTSIIGMGCRYKSHLDEKRELRKTKAEARSR
jgi:hypothetical protein